MNIIIRQELDEDYKISEQVVEEAFKNAEYSDHREHFLVSNLRKSEGFIPELSIVAEIDGEIAGHIMFTKLLIKNNEESYESLALAPVSVKPKYQNKGIGSKLITEGLRVAKELNFKSVIVLGHDKYYPKFGFKPTCTWGIDPPFDVPKECFMALELEVGSLFNAKGTVIYPKEFF